MYIIANKIINRIYGHGMGWCFTTKHFWDLGSPEAIRTSLHRLEKKGVIRRLAPGLYDYPKQHPTIGLLSPRPEQIAQAISERDNVRIHPSGAYAANLLGLTEQVPAKSVFLTDGNGRRLIIGQQEIVFRRTSPQNMATSGKASGSVIHALRHLGKKQISKKQIEYLKKTLNNTVKAQLKKDRKYAPNWMHPVIKNIVGESDVGIR